MSQQLDDHLVMLQSMGFSPYKKPFEERLAKWDTTFNLVGCCVMRGGPCHALHADKGWHESHAYACWRTETRGAMQSALFVVSWIYRHNLN
jgi:hypothetical protein